MSQRKLGIALVGTLLLSVLPVSVAIALYTTSTSNTSQQSIGTASWSASAGVDSTTAPTGSAYGPITPSNASSCSAYTKTTDGPFSGPGKDKVNLTSITNLVVGMTVTGTGITNSGTNTISNINVGRLEITLSSGPNTSTSGTQLLFNSGVCTYDQYLSINNRGVTDMNSFTLITTSTSTSGKSIALQACTGGTWNETTDLCSGTISTLTTTIGSGTGANSPQSSHISISIAQGGNLRLRALSTQSGASLTVGIQVARANLRASASTNN